jgi:WD40 repeat protein
VRTTASPDVKIVVRVVVAATLLLGTAAISTPAVAATPGSVLWAKRYGFPSSLSDGATAVAVSPDGSTVFATGATQQGASGNDYGTVAYDSSTGVVRWARRYVGPSDTADVALAVAASPDGSSVFVTGSSAGANELDDFATVAYDASTGATLWVKRYNGLDDTVDVANAVAVSPNGATVFISGGSNGSTGFQDFVTIAYDASTGARAWIRRYGDIYDDVATSLAVDPDGTTVFVTGYSTSSRGRGIDYATVAYGTGAGVRRWVMRYTRPFFGNDRASDVGVSLDGATVFVTGSSEATSEGYETTDYATLAYEASTGTRLWTKRYNGPGDGADRANALAVSSTEASIFVTGSDTSSTPGEDIATVAYTYNGVKLWVKRHVAPDIRAEANDIGVTPDGAAVVVTGHTFGSTTGSDYVTVAYTTSSGAKLWSKRYNGPADADDEAVGLAIQPDGSAVFVTGYSVGTSMTSDFGTIAYVLA